MIPLPLQGRLQNCPHQVSGETVRVSSKILTDTATIESRRGGDLSSKIYSLL